MNIWPVINSLLVLVLGIAGLWVYRHRRFLGMGFLFFSIAGVVPLASQFCHFFSGKTLAISFASLALSTVCFGVGGLQALGKYRRRIGSLDTSPVLHSMLEKKGGAKALWQDRQDR